MFKNAIVAGTFDALHSGHRALFSKALSSARRITVGLTSDSFAKNRKRRAVNVFEKRKKSLVEFLGKDAKRTSFSVLNDEFGDSANSRAYDAIVVSSETEPKANEINEIRKKNGLEPLAVLTIPMVYGTDREKISSTRIINGEIDAQGRALERTRALKKKHL